MNLLFIHGNFPGQFLDLAPLLAQKAGGRTLFLTESENPQGIQLPGVELVRFGCHRTVNDDCHVYLRNTEQAVLRGQAVLRALQQFQEQGFVPDVVIAHGGVGFGMFVKALLPRTVLVSYVEWFFGPGSNRSLFGSSGLDEYASADLTNLPVLQELTHADRIVCPTAWQRSQFPQEWQPRIELIFDGVDQNSYKPQLWEGEVVLASGEEGPPVRLQPEQKVLSYATRGMEPLRGFPEFLRAAAVAQQVDPQLQVVVAGRDRVAYSYRPNHPSGSWKQALLEELDGQLDLERLHFTGLVNYGELKQLFWRSDLQCMFSRPYVISWGLFQAAACGARLLVNDGPGLSDVFARPLERPAVNLEDQRAVNDAVLAGLAEPRLKALPEPNLRPEYNLQYCKQQWLALLESCRPAAIS